MTRRSILAVTFCIVHSLSLWAWAEHPLLVRPALEGLELWEEVDSVEAKSLIEFLEETGSDLFVFLEKHELWARENLKNYPDRPYELQLDTALAGEDLRNSFMRALRVNPESKIPLYLHLMPGDTTVEELRADPSEIRIFNKLTRERQTVYLKLKEGQQVHPLDVLVSANDEPDYGFDIGLFEDNGTSHGAKYGFGNQPFGNPNLANSSQGPFHMAFYHEAAVVNAVAPFLDNSLLESRLFLYRALSVFAFNQGEDYWGWRFLGWSMHYAGDLSMPYHSNPLPGYSVFEMVRSQLSALRGNDNLQRNMIQLVSNRHMALEAYQLAELRGAHLKRDENHPFLIALRAGYELPEFDTNFARKVASSHAAKQADEMSSAVRRAIPDRFVNDPETEARFLPELLEMDAVVRAYASPENLDDLNHEIAKRFQNFAVNVRAVLFSVVGQQ